MKKYTIFLLFLFFMIQLHAKEYSVTSPSERLTVKINVDENIHYSVFLDDKEIISPSPISMTLEDKVLGKDAKVRRNKTILVSEEIVPVMARKNARIPDVYNQITLSFKPAFQGVRRRCGLLLGSFRG